MSAPAFLRGNYSDLFGSSMLPVLEELFRANLERHPERRQEIFDVRSHQRDIWQSSELHDMPLAQQIAEGEDYTFSRPNQGASKTLTMQKFGLGFSISEEAVDDGKFDFIADAIGKMASSAKESREVKAINVINNGFGSEQTSDGVSIFNSAHTLPSGLEFRNQLSTNADLSVASLEQMLTDFETQFIGDTGVKYNKVAKVLLVHPSNKRLAKELIGSDLKAETSDNNMNSFKEEGLRVISSPHLTDTDAWFMLSAPSETGLRVIERSPIETKVGGADVGFINDSILYKVRYREQVGATHPYGVFGSPGA